MNKEMQTILDEMIISGCLKVIIKVEPIRENSDNYYVYGLTSDNTHILYSIGFDEENNEWMINWDGDW